MPVNPLNWIVLPLAFSLGILFLLATAYDLLVFHRRKNKRESIYRCEECHHIYAELHRTPLARCPKCGQQNEPSRR